MMKRALSAHGLVPAKKRAVSLKDQLNSVGLHCERNESDDESETNIDKGSLKEQLLNSGLLCPKEPKPDPLEVIMSQDLSHLSATGASKVLDILNNLCEQDRENLKQKFHKELRRLRKLLFNWDPSKFSVRVADGISFDDGNGGFCFFSGDCLDLQQLHDIAQKVSIGKNNLNLLNSWMEGLKRADEAIADNIFRQIASKIAVLKKNDSKAEKAKKLSRKELVKALMDANPGYMLDIVAPICYDLMSFNKNHLAAAQKQEAQTRLKKWATAKEAVDGEKLEEIVGWLLNATPEYIQYVRDSISLDELMAASKEQIHRTLRTSLTTMLSSWKEGVSYSDVIFVYVVECVVVRHPHAANNELRVTINRFPGQRSLRSVEKKLDAVVAAICQDLHGYDKGHLKPHVRERVLAQLKRWISGGEVDAKEWDAAVSALMNASAVYIKFIKDNIALDDLLGAEKDQIHDSLRYAIVAKLEAWKQGAPYSDVMFAYVTECLAVRHATGVNNHLKLKLKKFCDSMRALLQSQQQEANDDELNDLS